MRFELAEALGQILAVDDGVESICVSSRSRGPDALVSRQRRLRGARMIGV
jgi:hypothetical protein